MKALYILLIALLVAGCGLSPEQVTATADAAQAQTQTAAPTLTPTLSPTPTLTSTPTLTPTITPSPTPSIPKAQGRIQVNFLPLSDDAITPRQSEEVGMSLKSNGVTTIIKSSEADGSFVTYLEPGTYVIESFTVKNKDLGDETYEFITDQIEIEIPAQPCRYIGDITFTILRLPPGAFDEQVAMVQKLAGGAPVYFQFLETGGFLMPALTEVLGEGECPELSDAPDGFNWNYLPESSIAVLSPNDWHFLSETGSGTKAYFISLENINTEGSFKTGMTVNVVRDNSINATENARNFSSNIESLNNVTITEEVTERTEGKLIFYEMQYESAFSEYTATIHNLIVANKETNTLYVITFESPSADWEDAWEIGQIMIEQIIFLEDQ